MSRVVVHLPRVLTDLISCEPRIAVEGATVREALADLVRREPALAAHLFDESGSLRRHVLCFRNEVQARDRAELDQRLSAGDQLTLVNSVAGG